MSEPIEKEGNISLLVSASSAWAALGAGLSLLVLAFLSILSVVVHVSDHNLDTTVRDYLGPDLASTKRSNVKISAEGKSLELLVSSSETGSLEPVIYSWDAETGELSRLSSSEPEKQLIGAADELKFGTTSKALILRAKKGRNSFQKSWALNRWCLH